MKNQIRLVVLPSINTNEKMNQESLFYALKDWNFWYKYFRWVVESQMYEKDSTFDIQDLDLIFKLLSIANPTIDNFNVKIGSLYF